MKKKKKKRLPCEFICEHEFVIAGYSMKFYYCQNHYDAYVMARKRSSTKPYKKVVEMRQTWPEGFEAPGFYTRFYLEVFRWLNWK